jgi:predicted Zn-dependent protease
LKKFRNGVVLASVACLIAVSLAGCDATRRRPLSDVRASGNANYAYGQYTAALADYEEYLDRKPGSTLVRSRVGETLLRLNRPAEAEPHLRAVYDVEPLNTRNASLLAEAMVKGDRVGQGLDFMRRFLDQMPTSDGFFALSDLALSAGLPDDALQALQVARKLDGAVSAEPHRRLAKFYESRSLRSEAVESWRTVLWFDAVDAEASERLRQLGEVPGPGFALSPSDVE